MAERVIIKRATYTDWKDYRVIRLHALKNNPNSFSSSYSQGLKKTKKQWKSKLQDKNVKVFLAYLGKLPIGMVVLAYEEGSKISHLAGIYSMYVKPDFRGKGVASQLMNAVLKDIKSKKNIKKVSLRVVTEQRGAIKLYEKFGFKIIATLKKEMKIGKKYYDDYLMEKML